MTNSILKKQDDERGQRLLSARQQSFSHARHLFILQFVLMVVGPLLAWIYVSITGENRPQVASVILMLTIFDVTIIDRLYKEKIKFASLIAQEFDTYLFNLPWYNLFTGNPADAESISSLSRDFFSKKSGDDLKGWYSLEIDGIPLYFSTLLCQRMNVSYDSGLRKIYKNILLFFFFIIAVLFFSVAVALNYTINTFILSILLPAAPLVIWGFREYFRQVDALTWDIRICEYIEGILNGVIDRQIDAELARDEARLIQNALYIRRSQNPLPFPGIYNNRRKRLEAAMHEAARHWCERFTAEFHT